MTTKYIYILLLFFSALSSRAQIISTFAGGGASLSDNIPATSANIGLVSFGAFDAAGNYYFGSGQNKIKTIDNGGYVHTVAGTGSTGYSGDNGPATDAQLHFQGCAVDAAGNIFIGDFYNNRIRKVDAVSHVITTIAGNGTPGSTGDGFPATAAEVMPSGICVSRSGDIFFVDSAGLKVREINVGTGIISTVAGNGTPGSGGDGTSATSAQLTVNLGICTDSADNLYIACVGRIRKVNMSTGIINTYAGNGSTAYIGDGMSATDAQFQPYELGMDKEENILYVADVGTNNRVYKIDAIGVFYLLVGNGTVGFSGDGNIDTAAEIHNPEGVSVDTCHNIYIADEANERIRRIIIDTPCYVHNIALFTIVSKTQFSLSIYPNPTNETLHIDNVSAPEGFKLLNIIGANEQEGVLQAGDNTITLQALPAGMYMLVLTDDEGKRSVSKIIKQ